MDLLLNVWELSVGIGWCFFMGSGLLIYTFAACNLYEGHTNHIIFSSTYLTCANSFDSIQNDTGVLPFLIEQDSGNHPHR